MAISIGIDYHNHQWYSCLLESGRVLECTSFEDATTLQAYLEHTCTLYPEPVIALSSHLHVPLSSLNMLVEDLQQTPEPEVGADAAFYSFLIALNKINFCNYVLPGIEYLESIPLHRRLYRGPLGDAGRLCRIATLLYRLRLLDTLWPTMCFLYLEIGYYSSSVAVVQEGRLVDAIAAKAPGEPNPYSTCVSEQYEHTVVAALLEMITQDLAGLLALHHYEDVVLIYDALAAPCESLKKAVVDRFGDLYQLYLYPSGESEPGTFDTAIGAAILAEGLSYHGLTAEVVERLLSPLAQS
jgi:predicted butyrate kinase (DUF1464 family)